MLYLFCFTTSNGHTKSAVTNPSILFKPGTTAFIIYKNSGRVDNNSGTTNNNLIGMGERMDLSYPNNWDYNLNLLSKCKESN